MVDQVLQALANTANFNDDVQVEMIKVEYLEEP